MGLHLYNTLTRSVEPFEPVAPPRVTFYACGPTVYNYAHIGNFRTFIFEDLLRRYLEYSGYDVFQMMNLTDVDDRTIDAAASAGITLIEQTDQFVAAFFADVAYLRIKPADVYPRATRYIEPMVELVQGLLDRELAYKSEDGSVYFAVDRFTTYGRLSRLDKRELKTGARVVSDEYAKEDARDFALWKAAAAVDEQVEAAWDSPFGRGRPGWHLECSAMAMTEVRSRFGVETVDIHAGAVDLIFPHHENEIAQSEGVTGKPFVRYWVHGEFLTVQGTKMSKRFGNFLTPRDLHEEGVDPATVRGLMFGTHYRQQLNFGDEGLDAAREGVGRVGDAHRRLADTAGAADPDLSEAAEELDRDFRNALDDDLNAPRAMAAVFNFVRRVNRELDDGMSPSIAAGALQRFDLVLDVMQILPADRSADEELVEWIEGRMTARRAARAARDFAAADAIRDELKQRGVELEDAPEGTRWKVVRT